MAQPLRQIRDVSRISAAYALCLGVVAGVGAHLVLSCLRLIWPELLDVDAFLGQAVFGAEGQKARELGLLVFFCLSAVTAYAYSLVLWSARRSGARVGLHLSLYHYLVNGAAMAATPALGLFALNTGWLNALVIFVLHLIFGSLFATLFDWSAIRDEWPLSIDAPSPRSAQSASSADERERRSAAATTSEA